MEEECYLCGSPDFHNYNGLVNVCWPCENEIDAGIFMTVYKKCKIEVAHLIPGHKTCGKVHGHSVDIVVGVRGAMDFKTGMVMDFKSLKEIIQCEIVNRFDHSYLNDTLPVPTAEYLAYFIFKQLKFRGLDVVSIRVHETENNYVEYDGNTTFKDDEDGFCGERQ